MSGTVKIILTAVGIATAAVFFKDVEKGLADGLKSAEPVALSLSDSSDDDYAEYLGVGA